MAGDFNKPTGSSLRTMFMQEIRDIIKDVALMVYVGTSNIPDGLIRYNASTKMFEKYTAGTTSWAALDLSAMNAGQVDGFDANVTPGNNLVAVASASGKLAAGWGGAASSLATLNASAKVVQDPASAGSGNGLDSDKLDGKHWVQVLSGSQIISAGGTAAFGLSYGSGDHTFYRFSTYCSGNYPTVMGYDPTVSYAYVKKGYTGQQDNFLIKNNTGSQQTFYYQVFIWM